jgi:hypothetical protein
LITLRVTPAFSDSVFGGNAVVFFSQLQKHQQGIALFGRPLQFRENFPDVCFVVKVGIELHNINVAGFVGFVDLLFYE